MRISDWSSDVCSSDLSLDRAGRICTLQGHHRPRRKPRPHLALVPPPPPPAAPRRRPSLLGRGRAFRCRGAYDPCAPARTRRLAAILHRGRAAVFETDGYEPPTHEELRCGKDGGSTC